MEYILYHQKPGIVDWEQVGGIKEGCVLRWEATDEQKKQNPFAVNKVTGVTLEELAENVRKDSNFKGKEPDYQLKTLERLILIYHELDVFEAMAHPVSSSELTKFKELFDKLTK